MDLVQLSGILSSSGLAGTAAIGFYLFFSERKENRKLTNDILTFAIKNTETMGATATAIASLKEVVKDSFQREK